VNMQFDYFSDCFRCGHLFPDEQGSKVPPESAYNNFNTTVWLCHSCQEAIFIHSAEGVADEL
jgi:hypothetical protein